MSEMLTAAHYQFPNAEQRPLDLDVLLSDTPESPSQLFDQLAEAQRREDAARIEMLKGLPEKDEDKKLLVKARSGLIANQFRQAELNSLN